MTRSADRNRTVERIRRQSLPAIVRADTGDKRYHPDADYPKPAATIRICGDQATISGPFGALSRLTTTETTTGHAGDTLTVAAAVADRIAGKLQAFGCAVTVVRDRAEAT